MFQIVLSTWHEAYFYLIYQVLKKEKKKKKKTHSNHNVRCELWNNEWKNLSLKAYKVDCPKNLILRKFYFPIKPTRML